MSFDDALTITFLGISVVFIGLILTSTLIYSFSIVNTVSRFVKGKSSGKKTANSSGTDHYSLPVTKIEPEILAVITAVLEVELRLSMSLVESKYTFKRNHEI